eukprot:scaffold664_cov260-Pinguiococcus_pyrenoidosus.AAC.32
MAYAFPSGEIRPLSCEPGSFGLASLDMLTLVDALDTLAIMGNVTEFQNAVRLVTQGLSFDVDQNVSVFETCIRALGGLLSAHVLASDARLSFGSAPGWQYRGELLALAEDLARRLLPAFDTPTRIPYGTVNLRHGVPAGETVIASTAGAGTLSLELAYLSVLTQNGTYAKAGDAAALGLWNRRSKLDLVGKHINTQNGQWTEPVAGMGSNADSFYEYLAKRYLLSGLEDPWLDVFREAEEAVERSLRVGDWYADVDVHSGDVRRMRFESLHAFWPGLQALMGDARRLASAARSANAFWLIAKDWNFLPEEFDYVSWQLVGSAHPMNPTQSVSHPLRPELLETTYYFYRITGDPSWLTPAIRWVESLDRYSRTPCGFTVIRNVLTRDRGDEMPSFFLSETLKYLYLLFDEDHWLHDKSFLFTTEAHILYSVSRDPNPPQNFDGRSRRAALPRSTAAKKGAEAACDGWNELAPSLPCMVGYEDSALHNQCAVVQYPAILALGFQWGFQDKLLASTHSLVKAKTGQCPVQKKPPRMPAVSEDEGVLQVVDTPMGAFSVEVLSDGVSVVRQDDGSGFEYTQMVQDSVFLRAYGAHRAQVTLLDSEGSELRCGVALDTDERGSSAVHPDDALINCTPAAFGPSSEQPYSSLDGIRVHGPIKTVPERAGPLGCLPYNTERTPLADYQGAIIVVPRGECTFEQKALLAEQAGAAAVVVVNNVDEDVTLVMAGTSPEDGPLVHPSTSKTSLGPDRLSIPAVMVAKMDGDALKELSKRDRQAEIILEVTPKAGAEAPLPRQGTSVDLVAEVTAYAATVRDTKPLRMARPLPRSFFAEQGVFFIAHEEWSVLISGTATQTQGEDAKSTTSQLLIIDNSVEPFRTIARDGR